MKLSQYHQTHGLDAQIRLTRTGESLHIQLPKGVTREHITATVGGMAVEGYVELAPRPDVDPNDPIDCVLLVVLPGAVQAVPRARAGGGFEAPDPYRNHSAFRADRNLRVSPVDGRLEPVPEERPSPLSSFEFRTREEERQHPVFDPNAGAFRVNELNPASLINHDENLHNVSHDRENTRYQAHNHPATRVPSVNPEARTRPIEGADRSGGIGEVSRDYLDGTSQPTPRVPVAAPQDDLLVAAGVPAMTPEEIGATGEKGGRKGGGSAKARGGAVRR